MKLQTYDLVVIHFTNYTQPVSVKKYVRKVDSKNGKCEIW